MRLRSLCFGLVSLLALGACAAPTRDDVEAEEADSEDALTAKSFTLTKQGLVGSYFAPASACTYYASLSLAADGTFKATFCGVGASSLEGTWAVAKRTLTLTSGSNYKFSLAHADRFVEEPALDALKLKLSNGAAFRLARKGPVDDVLGAVNPGETREFRYVKGTPEPGSAYSLSAVTVDVREGERVTVRVESDYPLYVGTVAPIYGANRGWRTAYAVTATYARINPNWSQGSTKFYTTTMDEALLMGAGRHVVVFGAMMSNENNAGAHVRVSAASDTGTPRSASAFTTGGNVTLNQSDLFRPLRSTVAADVSITEEPGGLRLSSSYAPCRSRSGAGLTISLKPDGAGGYSGVRDDDKMAYASVRILDGKVAVHMELFDNFIQGRYPAHPYLNASSCAMALQGVLAH